MHDFADTVAPYPDRPTCRDEESIESFHHAERIWWLLAPNPFLIVPDVVAAQDNPKIYQWRTDQPPPEPTLVSPIAESVSAGRVGPYVGAAGCGDESYSFATSETGERTSFYWAKRAHEHARIGDSWYLGLLANAVFGGIGLVIAGRRLRVPAGKLSKGVRIA